MEEILEESSKSFWRSVGEKMLTKFFTSGAKKFGAKIGGKIGELASDKIEDLKNEYWGGENGKDDSDEEDDNDQGDSGEK